MIKQERLVPPEERTIRVNGKEVKELPFRELVPSIPNTTYLTHGIHSHPAKFIPQIPRYFIQRYIGEVTKEGGKRILDPFCGSGTTLLEAMLLGHKGIGIDINPLATLISKVKTTPFSPSKLEKKIGELIRSIKNFNGEPAIPSFTNIDYWYEAEAQEKLGRIKKCIQQYKNNEKLYNFFRVAFSTVVTICFKRRSRY